MKNASCTISSNGTCTLPFSKIQDDDELPCVSVVTITRDRPSFYELMVRNIQTIYYPKNKIEWVVLEDGSSRFDTFACTVHIPVSFKYLYIRNNEKSPHVFPIEYKHNRVV